MAENKENDFLVSRVLNPDLELANLSEMGLTSDNTQFRDRDFYKSKLLVQDTFTNEETGKFDEDVFNKVYDGLLNEYQGFSQGIDKSDLDRIEYSYSNAFRPQDSKVYKSSFDVSKVKNPLRLRFGINGIGTVDESFQSISEIAQTLKIFDFDKNEFVDSTPNDRGIFGFFDKPLVLAQWDEDGEHLDVETNKMINHVKGEYKTNDDGDYFYETLGDRDILGKSVLSAFDTLTTDGSLANKFDVFDADDKEQSVTKTILKNAIKFAPVAAGAIIGGPVAAGIASSYLGATAIYNLAAALPSLYKGVEGIFTNEDSYDNRTALWKMMNQLEARTKTAATGVSEYSKNNIFTWENTINMIGDVGLQLGQQRWVAEIPSKLGLQSNWINKAADINEQGKQLVKFNDFLKNLATLYMTLTSGTDSYNAAREAGHSDRTAGLIMLGTLAGLHKVMKSEIGQWPLKGIGLDDVRFKASLVLKEEGGLLQSTGFRKLASGASEVVENAAASVQPSVALTKSKNVMKTVSDYIKSRVGGFIENPHTLIGAGISEAFEEVSEELVQDFVMGVAKGAEALNITRKSDWSFTDSNPLERYLMSAFGGAIGGSIHHINFSNAWTSSHKLAESGEKEGLNKLLNAVYKYTADVLIDEVNRLYKNKQLPGDYNLSSEAIRQDGEAKFITATKEEDTLAFTVKENLINLIQTYDKILRETGSGGLDLDVRRALNMEKSPELAALQDFGLTRIVSDQLGYYNKKIVDTLSEKETMLAEGKDVTEVDAKLNEFKLEKANILNGGKFDNYFLQAILHLDKELLKPFFYVDIHDFTLAKTNKKYEDLSEYEKKNIDSQFSDYLLNIANFGYEGAVKVLNNGLERLAPHNKKYTEEFGKIRALATQSFAYLFDQHLEKLDILREESDMVDPLKLEKLKKGVFFDKEVDPNNEFVELGNDSLSAINKNIIEQDGEKYVITRPTNVTVRGEDGNPVRQHIPAKKIKLSDFKLDLYSLLLAGLHQFEENNLKVDEDIKTELEKQNKAIETQITPLFKLRSTVVTADPIINFQNSIFTAENAIGGKIDEKLTERRDELAKIIENLSEEDLNYVLQDLELDESESDKIVDTLMDQYKEKSDHIKSVTAEYELDINFLNESRRIMNDSMRSPVYEYLEEVTKLTSNNSNPIFDLLRAENSKLNSNIITEYVSANPIGITKALLDLQMAKTLIEMSMNLPGSGSYVLVVNHYREKYAKDLNPFLTIDFESGALMLQDLSLIDRKLKFFQSLSQYNSSDKLKEHSNTLGRMNAFFVDLFLKTDGTGKGVLEDISKNLGYDLTEGMDTIIGDDIEGWNSIQNVINALSKEESPTKEDLAKSEILLTKLEDLLYDNVLKSYEAGKTKQDIAKALTHDGTFKRDYDVDSSFVNGMTSVISSKSKGLTDFDKVMYLTGVIAGKSGEFKTYLKQVLTDVDEDGKPIYDKAPIFAHEYVAKMSYSYIQDSELYDLVLNETSAPDKDGRMYHKFPVLPNLLFINGYHGTGKTTGALRLTYEILKKSNPDSVITLTSIIDRQVDKLRNDLRSTDNGYNKNNLLKSILGTRKINEFVSKEEINSDEISKLTKNDKLGNIIFIDEVTHYGADELKFLTTYCKINNIKIISVGDTLLMGYKGADGKYTNIEYLMTAKSPTLEYSMRSGSSVVKENADMWRTYADQINERDGDNSKKEEISRIFKDNFGSVGNFEIKYFENKDGSFYGTKVVERKEFTKESVNNYIKTQSAAFGSKPEDFVIIYGTENLDNYKILKEISTTHNIPFIKYTEMQGGEWDNVIIDVEGLNVTNGNRVENIVELAKMGNTIFSRNVKSSFVNNTNLNIKNLEAKFNTDLALDVNTLNEYRKNRISILEEATKDVVISSKPNKVSPISKSINKPVVKSNSTESLAITEMALAVKTGKQIAEIEPEELTKGRDKADGKLMGFTNANILGVVKDKNGNYIINRLNNIGLALDLQCFNTAYFEDDDSVTLENTAEFVTQSRELDQARKEILLMKDDLQSGKITVDKIFDKYQSLSDANNRKIFGKGDFRIIVKKSDDFDNNLELEELHGTYKNDEYVRLLVYMSEDGESYITLSLLGTKTNEDEAFTTLVNNSITKINNGDKFVSWHIDASDINPTGSITRILKTSGSISLADYKSKELGYVVVSEPMIITGRTPELNTLRDIKDDEDQTKLRDILDDISMNYNLNGRPVIFATKDVSLKGKSGKELAKIFYDQKVKQYDAIRNGTDYNEPSRVSMLVLETRGYKTVNEFLTALNDAIDSTTGQVDAIKMVSHDLMGLSMLKSLYETRDYLFSIAAAKRTPAERTTLGRISTMIKIAERTFNVKAVHITDAKGVKHLEIAMGDPVKVTINGEEKLKEVVINPENIQLLKEIYSKTNDNVRSIINDQYYKRMKLESGNTFHFSDIIFLLEHITKNDVELLLGTLGFKLDEIKTMTKKGNLLREALEYAMMGKAEISVYNNSTKKYDAVTLERGSSIRFPDGIFIHPVYKRGTDSNSSFSITDWCMPCANPDSDFILKNSSIEGLRLLLNLNNVKTSELHAQNKLTEKEEFDNYIKEQVNVILTAPIKDSVKTEIINRILKITTDNKESELDSINNYLTTLTMLDLNNAVPNVNPVVSFVIVDDKIIPLTLKDVLVDPIDGIIPFIPTSNNIVIETEDGNKYEYYPKTNLLKLVDKGLEAFNQLVLEFNKDIDSFLELLNGYPIQANVLNLLKSLISDNNFTFQNVSNTIADLSKLNDPKLIQTFKELMNRKIELYC